MAFQIVSTQTVLARNAGALYGVALSNTLMTNLAAQAGSTNAGMDALLNTIYVNSVGNATPAAVADELIANLGITGAQAIADAKAYIVGVLGGVAVNARGAAVNGIISLFSQLTDATYGGFATAYNAKVVSAEAYAATATNTGFSGFASLSTVAPAGTFTLTTGADNFVGTASADTFNASLAYASGGTTVDTTSTLSVADQISGGAGVDTLNVTITGGNGGTTFAAANITGVEVLNLRNVSGQTNSLDVSTIAGLTGVYADRATSTVTLTNVADAATVGVKGDGTAANGAFNFGYKTDAAAINLSISGGVTAGAITGNSTTGTDAATAATISSTGAANVVGTVDLLTGASTLKTLTINAATNLKGQIAAQAEGDFAAASTLTISGAATLVELTSALANNITTVNASGMTAGGLKATLGTGTVTATGGAGKDTITLGAVDAIVSTGAGDDKIAIGTNILTGSVNGGDGTDTVTIAAGNALTSATAAKITNVEVLEVSSAATQTYDYSLISGLTALTVNTGTSIIVNKLGAATPVTVTGVQTTDLALNLASASGTTDSLNLTLSNQDAADLTVAALSITGVETLNVTSTYTPATPAVGTYKNVITTLAGTNNTALQTVTLAGATEVSVTTGALNQSLAINASAATGKTTIDASSLAGVATITGGSGVDTITTSAQADTVNAGAGNDVINLDVSGGNGSADTLNGEAGNDNFKTTAAYAAVAGLSINGGDGTDSITVKTGVTSNFSATGVTISSIEKLAYDTAGGTTGATFSGAQLNNSTIEVTGAGGTDTLTVALVAGGSTDLSKLTFVSWTAGTDVIAINGSTSGETIKGSTQNDTITAGAGIDTIDLSAGGNDTVVFGAGAALIAANRDNISGFTAGTTAATKDTLTFTATDTTATTNAGSAIVIQAVTTAPTGTLTFTSTNDVLALNFEAATGTGKVLADSADGTALLASLGQTLDITTDQHKGLIVAYQAGNAYIYAAAESNDAGAAFAAADIALVGVVNGVAVGSLVAGNFVLA